MDKSYSIVIATYNKAWALPQVFDSLLPQLDDDGELIVVDDGSTDETPEICTSSHIRYVRLNDAVGKTRNPAVARNVGYRMAAGEIIVAQSDDVVHVGKTIGPLVDGLRDGEIHIATVWDFKNGARGTQYTGDANPRPLFFLGSVFRKDLYAVGGNDQDFRCPGREDRWFGDCLTRGLGLKPVYRNDVVGHHLHHKQISPRGYGDSRKVYARKVAEGKFISAGGAWQ